MSQAGTPNEVQAPSGAPAAAAQPDGAKVEKLKKRTTLARRFLRSNSTGVKLIGYLLLAFWWTVVLLLNLPMLFTYWGEYRYERERKFNIYPMPKMALFYPVMTTGVLLGFLVGWAIPASIAAYFWIVFLIFAIFTIADEITWPGGSLVFFIFTSLILGLAALGMYFQLPIFLPAWTWLESFKVPYPTVFVNAICAFGGIVLFLRIIVELSRVHISVQGNTFRVIMLGVKSELHSIADYEVRVEIRDFNERMVFGCAVLMLVPNDPNKPTYEFIVYGAHIVAQLLQEMKDAPDVEIRVRASA